MPYSARGAIHHPLQQQHRHLRAAACPRRAWQWSWAAVQMLGTWPHPSTWLSASISSTWAGRSFWRFKGQQFLSKGYPNFQERQNRVRTPLPHNSNVMVTSWGDCAASISSVQTLSHALPYLGGLGSTAYTHPPDSLAGILGMGFDMGIVWNFCAPVRHLPASF